MAVVVTNGAAAQVQNPNFSGGNSTFTNTNGGANYPSGSKIVVAVAAKDHGSFSAVTVGGQSMTKAASGFTDKGVELWFYDAGSATGDTVVITDGNGGSFVGVCSWYLTGVASGASAANATDVAQDGTPIAVTLALPSNGAIIAACGTFSLGSNYSPTWTGLTGDFSQDDATHNFQIVGGHSTASSDPSLTNGGLVPYDTLMAASSWAAAGVAGPAIAGITKNNSGAVLGSCDVFLLQYNSGSTTLTQVDYQVSNASTGAYSFTPPDGTATYMVLSFKDGAPNVFDVTDHNLQQA